MSGLDPINDCIQALQGNTNTWYDLAAHAYSLIKRNIRNEELFIGTYIDKDNNGGFSNPNLDTLEDFKLQVSGKIARAFQGDEDEQETRSFIQEQLKGIRLQPFGEEHLNNLTPLYAVIKAIDLACGMAGVFYSRRKRGPLNDVHRNEFGVYFKSSVNAVATAARSYGIERIPEHQINDQLQYLLFYEKREHPSLPVIRLITQASHKAKSTLASTTKFVFGLAPFCSENPLRPNSDGITFAQSKGRGGASFGVDYHEAYAEHFADSVTSAIDTAIQHGCQILIFPELVMSKDLQQLVSDHLSSQRDSGELSLVVAGSCWDAVTSDNVSRLYDGRGNYLGSYYKCAAYSSVKEDAVEALSHPGKECTLVDIPALGRVVPAICKDVVSDRYHYTQRLVEAFEPVVVSVPACSASVEKGFAQPFEVMASRFLALPCLSNVCGVRKGKGDTTIDVVMAPAFSEPLSSTAGVQRIDAKRSHLCAQSCRGGSCLWVVTVDYKQAGELPVPSCDIEQIDCVSCEKVTNVSFLSNLTNTMR